MKLAFPLASNDDFLGEETVKDFKKWKKVSSQMQSKRGEKLVLILQGDQKYIEQRGKFLEAVDCN